MRRRPRDSSENALRPPFCAREVAFERGERGASRGANGWPREDLKRRRHAARRTPEFGHLRQRRQRARGGELEARAAPGRRPEHVDVLVRPWQRLQRRRLAARRSSARPSMAMAVTGAEKSNRRREEERSSPPRRKEAFEGLRSSSGRPVREEVAGGPRLTKGRSGTRRVSELQPPGEEEGAEAGWPSRLVGGTKERRRPRDRRWCDVGRARTEREEGSGRVREREERGSGSGRGEWERRRPEARRGGLILPRRAVATEPARWSGGNGRPARVRGTGGREG